MRSILSLLAVTLATPVQAQTEIVVTGVGLDTQPPAAQPVATIDRDRLIGTASNRLEDALGDAAGLQSFRRADSRSANPTSQGLTLRGIGGNASSRALLILDGVPQADPFAGWVAFPAYSPERLGRVRVMRGGGSGVWGPGALSGVVELTSATPDQLPPFTASAFYGERNAVEANASASLVRGSGFATLTAGYARGDGFAPIVAEDRGPADRAAPFEQFNASARTVIGIAPDTELQATLQGFTDRRDRGLAFTGIESDGADASLRLVGRGPWRWSALGYVQTRCFASSFASVDAARTASTQTLDQYNVPATGIGARVDLAPPVGEGVSLRFGGDVRQTSGVTEELYTFVDAEPTRRREAGGTTRTLGGFAELAATLGAVTIDGNARLDGWWIEDGRLFEAALAGGAPITDTRFADRSGTEATGRLGASWAVAAPLKLRAAAYRSWRLPTPNELYRPFRAGADATAANAGLRPETVEGVEGGFDLNIADRFGIGATLFHNRLNDAVANVTVARGPGTFPGVGFVSAAGFYRRRDNLDAIESTGVEVDARATLGAVRLGASYAYADARVKGSALDGLRPAQVPQHQASATAGWRQWGWSAATTLRYVSGQFEDDQNSRSLNDALTVDAVLSTPLGRSLEIVARGENMFDARVEAGFSGVALERARPRQLWLGLRMAIDPAG